MTNNNNSIPKSMMEDMYLDNKDFLARYMFNPDIQDEANFQHLDKNLAMTRLSSRYNEPDRARSLLSALHVLNNNNYFREERTERVIDIEETTAHYARCPSCNKEYLLEEESHFTCCENDLTTEQVLIKKPVKQLEITTKTLFPRTYHMLKSSFISFVTTSMARDGHLIRQATTTNFHQSSTMEDRTKVKGGLFGISKTTGSNGGR